MPLKRKRADGSPSSVAVPSTYSRMDFPTFCVARQEILEKRRQALPRDKWTDDPVLANARFCNIDRRDDAVTAELLGQIEQYAKQWTVRDKVLLAAALRFTGSRRGEAEVIAALVEAGRSHKDRSATPLRGAFAQERLRCGTGTYQLSLNRKQVATVIEDMALAVSEHVASEGPFADVLEASDFVAELMTVGKRPQFSANETAKDFAYIDGLMKPASHHRCRLGPGARKGLVLVRQRMSSLLSNCHSEEAAVASLRTELRRAPSLAWVETIDVEQALCEYSKYEAYVTTGISAGKRFKPSRA